MMPEQQAGVSIDAILQQADWHVCSLADANIHAARGVSELDNRLFHICAVVAEVNDNLNRAQALRHLALFKAFSFLIQEQTAIHIQIIEVGMSVKKLRDSVSKIVI